MTWLGALALDWVACSQLPLVVEVETEKPNPVGDEVTLICCEPIEPPSLPVKVSEDGEAESAGPVVTFRVTETVTALPEDGVNVIVPE